MKRACIVALTFLAAIVETSGQVLRAQGWQVEDRETDDAVFGFIRSAAMDAQGRLYVLDNAFQRVSVFDRTGRLVAAVGRSGWGPGEFSAPTRVIVTKAGTSFILDTRRGQLIEYGWNGTRFSHIADHRLTHSSRDVCMRGDTLMSLAASGDPLVVGLIARGGSLEPAVTFGELASEHPDFSNAIIRGLRGVMLASCSGKVPFVVAVGRQVGEMQWLTSRGMSRLEAIPGFSGVEMIVRGNAVENRMPQSGVADLVEASVMLPDSTIILSIGEIVGTTSTAHVFGRYRLTRVKMGQGIVEQSPSQWVLAFAGDDGVVCVRNDPVPAVKVVWSPPTTRVCETMVPSVPAPG